jgi:hypothetical protein
MRDQKKITFTALLAGGIKDFLFSSKCALPGTKKDQEPKLLVG